MVAKGWTKRATVNWKLVVAPHAMRVPIRNLRELLWEEALADGNTKKRFEAWAAGDCRDVRFEADTRIAAEMKHGFVPDYNDLSLYEIQQEAEDLEKSRPEWAESIYMGLTESLGVHYNMIDDSMGDFWPLFEECMSAMGGCIRRQNPSGDEKRWRIEYLAYWSTVVFEDFMEYYEKELAKLCVGVEELNLWHSMLEYVLKADDIGDRNCYWAARKERIEESRARVMKMIIDAKEDGRDPGA